MMVLPTLKSCTLKIQADSGHGCGYAIRLCADESHVARMGKPSHTLLHVDAEVLECSTSVYPLLQ